MLLCTGISKLVSREDFYKCFFKEEGRRPSNAV